MTHSTSSTGRRQFLLKALGLSAAGLAAGGAAAMGKDRIEQAFMAEATVPQLQTQLNTLTTTQATLEQQLSVARTQLEAALKQNEHLSTTLSASQREAATLKTELADSQTQLTVAHTRLGNWQELGGLYDSLERLGLDTTVEQGLLSATGGLAAALGLVGAVRAGLTTADNSLTRLDGLLADFDEAMQWLGDQMVVLRVGMAALEAAAQKTISQTVNGLNALFGGFIDFILDHLPFDLGTNVRQTLQATQNLLAALLDMADGTDDKVLGRITRHVSKGQSSLRHTLIAPVREQALAPTKDLLTALNDADQTFNTTLRDPAREALAKHAELRANIQAFKQTHEL